MPRDHLMGYVEPLPALGERVEPKPSLSQAKRDSIRKVVENLRFEIIDHASDENMYRVWPDGTVQDVEDGPPHSHMSDDYTLIVAFSEGEALRAAADFLA